MHTAAHLTGRLAARLAPRLATCLAVTLTACVNNAPTEDPLSSGAPTLTLTPALPCTDPILPQFAPNGGGTPTTASFEVSLTGVTASASAGLAVELSYEAPRPPACFVSALEQRADGSLNYRCMDVKSAPLTMSARRAYDSIYCIATGPLAVTASVTLADGTKVTSEPVELLCQSEERFTTSCTPVGVVPDMEVPDMEAPDMAAPDMDIPPLPSEWSVVYNAEGGAPLELAVQGSTSDLPTSGTYSFKVIDQRGEPISGAQTRFFLNWSPASDYPVCGLPCAELGEGECGERDACAWDPEAASGLGACRRDAEWRGTDERCDSVRARCEANLCLPTSNSGGVSLITALPVSLSPLVAYSDEGGEARVSLVAQEEPGVFSVRAEATLGGRTLQAVTPPITVTHHIPTQRNFSVSCTPSVSPGFSRRVAPNEALGTDLLGYLSTYQPEMSSCEARLSDRYNGAVSSSALFFMSEAGSISQTTGDEPIARLSAGRPSPMDLAPCNQEELGCEYDELRFPLSSPGLDAFNPRDGLNRVIAVTVGEADFIDLDPNPVLSASNVGVYNPGTDFVPAHSEPYVDANDNGVHDAGEAYFDANRNGYWDVDVFGRLSADDFATELAELKCIEGALRSGVLPDDVRCGNTIDLSTFIGQNPASLRAHIWTSDLVLQVGLMKEPEVVLSCEGACATTAEAFTSTCVGVPPGLDAYVDAWTGGAVRLSLPLSDDNLNCLGIVGVTLNASLEGELTPLPVEVRKNQLPIIYGSSTPSRDSCFDQDHPLLPRARTYVTRFGPTAQPEEGEAPSLTISYFNLKVTTPDYSEGDGVRERIVSVSVGVCH